MTEPILLYDYSPVTGTDRDLCRQIQQHIADKAACQLVDLLDGKDRTNPRPEIFQEEPDGTLWTRQYIGLFEYQGQRVVISSRFDKRRHGKEQPTFFLWYLMENYLGESMLALEDVDSTRGGLFESLLTAKLAVQLQQAWKKGTLRAYRTFDHNDSQVRGQLDISRHIRENMGLDNGCIAYRTREYSMDNAWNVLFLQAVEAARRRNPDLLHRLERRLPEFHTALRVLEQEIPRWAQHRRSWVLEHTRRKNANPIYRDYEAARLTARDILRRMGTDLSGAGSSGSVVTGVFLDLNTLWERLLEDQLFRGAFTPFAQQPKDILRGHAEICPDFLWQKQKVVLDAKNRPVWGRTLDQEGKWSKIASLSSADKDALEKNTRQVFTYMLALNCTDGGVIFPVSGNRPRAPISDPIDPTGLQFWRIPILIPITDNYPAFCRAMAAEWDRLRKEDPIRNVIAQT